MEDIDQFLDNLYEGEIVKPHSSSKTMDYFITNYGRFIAKVRNPSKWCKHPIKFLTQTSIKRNDYHRQVRLPDGTVDVSREVGKHFLKEFREDLCVCHRDEDLPEHLVNSVWNLWMGTIGENTKDAYDKGRKTWSNQTYKHRL